MPCGEARAACYGPAMNRVPALLAAASAIVLSGCASAGDYPSLARRPAEGSVSPDPAICPANREILALADDGLEPGRVAGSAQPAPALSIPRAPTAPSRDLTTRLAQLVEQARAAHSRFGDRRAAAERAVAAGSGAAQGSEAWAAASVALSGLETARSDALVALGELDQRFAELTTAEAANTFDIEAVSAARDQVESIVMEEDMILAGLRRRLS